VAASNGQAPVCRVLLGCAAGDELVRMLDGNGATPLLWAACSGNVEVVALLLVRGPLELLHRSLVRSVEGDGGLVLGYGANAAMVAGFDWLLLFLLFFS